MYIMLGIVLVLTALFLVFLFLVTPNLSAREKMPFFVGRNIAHRGLYSKEQGIPENSLPAAKLAVDANYPIELDIRLSKDKEVVVFHDDTLERVTNATGKVEDYTLLELQAFSLEGSKNTIPTFYDFLKTVDGKVPIVIEVKNNFDNPLLCKKAMELLETYSGDYAIKSFQPDIVLWFKNNSPDVLRGQLATRPEKGSINPILGFLSSYMVLNFLTKPHFISYDLNQTSNLSFRLAKKLGAMVMLWTIKTPEDLEKAKNIGADSIIFENISPAANFKSVSLQLEKAKKQAAVSTTKGKIED